MNTLLLTGKARVLNRCIALLVIVALAGCSSMQTVDKAPANLHHTLVAGDALRVVDKQGRKTELTFTAVENGVLKGRMSGPKGIPVELRLEDIDTVEVKKTSTWRSALVGTGAIYALIVFMAVRSL
jgi:hypothetical protein